APGRAAEADVDAAGELAVELGRPGHHRVGDEAGVGQAVEGLVEPDAGVLGAHDVAKGVAAGGAGGETEALDLLQDVGYVAGVDPVELDALPGGEVRPVLCVPGRQAAQAAHLLAEDDAAGHAHPDHEDAVLELGAD